MSPTTPQHRPVVLAAVAALSLAGAACRRAPAVSTPAPDTTRPTEPAPAPIASAQELIQAMRDRYAGTWYRTLTFVQTSTYYRPDGTVYRTETWPESVMIPGRLRIDIGNPAIGNAVLYVNDTLYEFQQKRLVRRAATYNPLQILAFDVYRLPPTRTLEMLSRYGFDLSTLHHAQHEGRDYYVVGARPGETSRKQFWVEADRLLLWRLIEPWLATDAVNVREIRFQDYRQRNGGWIAEEVEFLRNGTRYFFEKYRDVRTDVEIDPALFDPRQFTTAKHWYRPPATGDGPRPR
jgi:hypothetical protein